MGKRTPYRKHALVVGILLFGSFMLVWSMDRIPNFGTTSSKNQNKAKNSPEVAESSSLHSLDGQTDEDLKNPTDLANLRKEESKQAFLAAYEVFMHPRCMNCHPTGDIPLQGDDSHLHTQGVKRGIDGKGVYANKCSNCHQLEKIEGEHLPPGNSVWHLPPAHRKMVFQGKSPRELAAGFKDSTFTGFHSVERIIEHVETDPLVKNGFTYGTRPPLTHEEFVVKVKEWIEKGAVLPDK